MPQTCSFVWVRSGFDDVLVDLDADVPARRGTVSEDAITRLQFGDVQGQSVIGENPYVPVVLHDRVDAFAAGEFGLDDAQRSNLGLHAADAAAANLSGGADHGDGASCGQLRHVVGAVVRVVDIAVHRAGID